MQHGRDFVAVNPATQETLWAYPFADEGAVERRLAAADRAWRTRCDVSMRVERLRDLARILRRDREALAHLATAEMGKPIRDAIAEVDKCALSCELLASAGPGWLTPEVTLVDQVEVTTLAVPRGVVLAVMPWNFPYWQALRCAAPALLAGNAVLHKPAPNVPGCALALEERLAEAGFGDGAFSTLFVDLEAVARLAADPRVHFVSLTGSTRAGRAVAALCGQHLKPSVLELGGSDAYVVLADADPEEAAAVCTAARLVNSGQSCIAGKRFIVESEVAEAFVACFVQRLAAARLGDPLDPHTGVGPLARLDLREELDRQVRASVAQGARCLVGGAVPPGIGWFYPPTVLVGVEPGMPAWQEELFGPVAAVRVVADTTAAIAAANDTAFGLGAAVLTRDAGRGAAVAAQLAAGTVCVNAAVRSDARVRFGGRGDSGWGCELGRDGFLELCQRRVVWSPARPA